jgi:hypothetical protein
MDATNKIIEGETCHFEKAVTESGTAEIDHLQEKKLLRKIDLHLIPILSLLLLCAFVDRYVQAWGISILQ